MYYLLGISISLAIFMIVNMTVATVTVLLWRGISGYVSSCSASARAQIIFGMRTLPVVAAFGFVLAFIIPAYLFYEPDKSGEAVSAKLAFIAGLCAATVIFAIFRMIRTWFSTWRLMRDWLAISMPVAIGGVDLPIHKFEHDFPVLAVVGVFKQKIFAADIILSSLSKDELRVAIAHESGHLRSRDNLKRVIMSFCRDLTVVPIGRDLDLAWTLNAEAGADEFAVRDGGRKAIDLASALVKITRAAAEGKSLSLPAGAYILSERNSNIACRVRRLLHLSDGVGAVPSQKLLLAPASAWFLGILLLLTIQMADQRLLFATHQAIEQFVRIIQ